MRNKFLCILTLAIIALSLPGCNKPRQESESPPSNLEAIENNEFMPFEGYLAPDFELEDLWGGKLKSSSFCGAMLVVNFWSLDVDASLEDLSNFDSLHSDMLSDRTLLMISMDQDVQKITRFIEDSGYRFPVFIDKDSAMAKAYAVNEVPTTLVIGGDNTVLARAEGKLGGTAIKHLADPATYNRPMVPM